MDPLTRRTFLERLGLTGGSALVMSAMRSWELMAAQAGPRPVLSGRPNGTKVIVLGAGVSGMTVTYELRKLGYNVSILEARDRVGGVNWTIRRGTTHTELGSGEKAGLRFRRRPVPERRPVAAAALAHRRARLLQGAGRAARDLHQRGRSVLLLLRGRQHRPAGEQAGAAARGQGGLDRLHLRAARQGRRSRARSIFR